MGRLARQHVLDPTSQLPLSHDRRRVQLHHKGAFYRQRSVGGWVGCNRSSCDVLLGVTTPSDQDARGRDGRSL